MPRVPTKERERRQDKLSVDPRFTPESLLDELENGEMSLASVLRGYTLDPTGNVKAVESRLEEWKQDDFFRKRFERVMEVRGESIPPVSKFNAFRVADFDPDLKDWREEYAQTYLETGSRVRAAEQSPYSYSQILDFLNTISESYDQRFAEGVRKSELFLAAQAEDKIVEAVREAKTPKDKVITAKAYLESIDKMRWGRERKISGTVDHTHVHQIESRETRLDKLSLDQKEHMALPPAPETMDIVDADYVEAKEEVLVEP